MRRSGFVALTRSRLRRFNAPLRASYPVNGLPLVNLSDNVCIKSGTKSTRARRGGKCGAPGNAAAGSVSSQTADLRPYRTF